MLEIETKTFEEKLSELIKTGNGKFVLIKQDQVIGTLAALADTLKSGYGKFREQPFFVRQILLIWQPFEIFE